MRALSPNCSDFCIPRFSRGASSQAEAFTSEPAERLCRNPSSADCAPVMFPLLSDAPICESRESNELPLDVPEVLEVESLEEVIKLVSES